MPVHYKGKMWCIKVATGAFVARRHGKIFITGNSGFPKSMDVSKAIDKALGAEREKVPNPLAAKQTASIGTNAYGDYNATTHIQPNPATDDSRKWQGWGTCLKPAWEPIIVARKPLDGTVAHNVLTWGCGAMNIDACRVGTEVITTQGGDSFPKVYGDFKTCPESQHVGRFPANLVHDGSQMVLELFPNSKGQLADRKAQSKKSVNCYGDYGTDAEFKKRGDEGSAARFFNALRDGEESADRTYADRGGTNFAAKPGMRREPTSVDRFFYCAKASKKDRGEGNTHPTVKPTALMEWLVKLVTPEGGVVLDPFMGSGTTGVACANLNRRFVGIEREWQYMEIAGPRIADREREFGLYEGA